MRVLISPAALFGWAQHKLDVNSALLQTVLPQREIYVITPRESRDRRKILWLLLTATDGVLNANSKWQHQGYDLLTNISFTNAPLLPQRFLMRHEDRVVAMGTNIGGDILIC